MVETELIVYESLSTDSIVEYITYGINITAIAIITAGLLGFTISKFIKIMKGGV